MDKRYLGIFINNFGQFVKKGNKWKESALSREIASHRCLLHMGTKETTKTQH
jgi:hypothetical protein